MVLNVLEVHARAVGAIPVLQIEHLPGALLFDCRNCSTEETAQTNGEKFERCECLEVFDVVASRLAVEVKNDIEARHARQRGVSLRAHVPTLARESTVR